MHATPDGSANRAAHCNGTWQSDPFALAQLFHVNGLIHEKTDPLHLRKPCVTYNGNPPGL